MAQLIEPSVELITEQDNYKRIELAGRTCYKSEDKITEDSAKKFVIRMFKNKHFAMLEHGIYYYICTYKPSDHVAKGIVRFIKEIPETNVTERMNVEDDKMEVLLSANLRSLIENGLVSYCAEVDDFQQTDTFGQYFKPVEYSLLSLTPEEQRVHKYTTMRFITDRGVTHEMVRHRKFSYGQESTRYVKYDNQDIKFIKPANYDEWPLDAQQCYFALCETTENAYDYLRNAGLMPQEARGVLPNALKTEIVVTGNEQEWLHFFELRCAKNAHPDIQVVANKAESLYYSMKNYG